MAGRLGNLLLATIALSFVLCSIGRAQQTGARDLQGPVAQISMPWNNCLVRANVPVFGVATAKDFKLYRVEFGEGPKPKEWHVIKVSTKPEQFDPWVAGKVKWHPSRGAEGNLATWQTGLTSYTYGIQQKNLNGVYTLRVVVEDNSGQTAEARVAVTVAREVTKQTGGIAESCDNRTFLNVAKDSISTAFLLVSIQPIDDRNPAIFEIKPPVGLVQVGKVYEFQPPGLRLTKPAAFRFCYDRKDLTHRDGSGREQELPEDKLGIYAYLPVEEVWAPLPGCKVHPETTEVRTQLTEVTRYISFYAVMADVTPPAAPAFDPVNAETEKGAVSLSGEAEPFSAVELFRGNAPLGRSDADVDGRFTLPDVPLVPGENVLTASAVDRAGNRSEASAVKVVRACHPPKTVKQVEILGKLTAERGDRLLVKLTGEDGDPKPNIAYCHVASETDPGGFELQLTETGPTTGIYVAAFTVGEKTDPARSAIAARKHREQIAAASAQDKTRLARIEYTDTVPPSAPRIESPTHPSVCQDTFEDTVRPLGEWTNIGGEYGAELSLGTREGNTCLKLTKQQFRGHLGAEARSTGYSAAKFPLIAFDYLVNPDVAMDFEVFCKGWHLIEFNEFGREDHRFGRKVTGRFPEIVSDGRWHHGELNLRSLLAAQVKDDREFKVEGLHFINLDRTAYLKDEFGRTGNKGAYYCMDNFCILGYGGRDATFNWSSQDDNGIAGYTYVLDRQTDTVPPERDAVLETTMSRAGLTEGRWYFHVRARDKCGNWGRANHYMIFVDDRPPRAEPVDPVAGPDGRSDWDTPVRLRIDDGAGSGVDPGSIRLRIGARVWSVDSEALVYDPAKAVLTFDPTRVRPYPLLWADGEHVDVTLVAASDFAGNAVAAPPSWSYVVRSPLKITPANPDGKNGWYVTPPKVEMSAPAGATVAYEWLVRPDEDALFKRGNSINCLRVTVTGGAGQDRVFEKALCLDTTIPAVKLRRLRDGGREVILLEHDDYALDRGGLTCRCYRTDNWGGVPFHVIETADLALDDAPGIVLTEAKSVSWTGMLRPPATGVYEILLGVAEGQRAELLINGETVARAGDQGRGAEVGKEVLLTNKMQSVEIRWRARAEGATPNIRLSWKTAAAEHISIPDDAFWYAKSLAQLFYCWDDGKEETYGAPIPVSNEKRVLHYYAVDEAGHLSEPGRAEIE